MNVLPQTGQPAVPAHLTPARIAIAAVLAPAVAVLGVAIAAVGSGALSPASASALTCTDGPVTAGVPHSGVTLETDQIANAQIIYSVGVALNIPDRGEIIAIATAMQESTLQNLDHGDADSIGLFQQRNAWGTRAARMDPATAAQMFYTGGAGGQRGLLDIAGWQSMSIAAAAQAVQVSAFPEAYARWEPIATALVATFAVNGGTCASDDNIPVPDDVSAELPAGYTFPAGTPAAVQVAISWAAAQLGTPYQWGGTCTNPHGASASGRCDCSSLVQQAYKAAGFTLPRTTSQQIHVGTPVYDTSRLRAGDLLFLPGHVGLYLGRGLVLHAPKTGDVVKVSQFQGYWVNHLIGMRRIVH
jgi:cell wall-associated NlpC family hydrolase